MQKNSFKDPTHQNLQNSSQIIRHLQQNQALRIELYKLRITIKAQQSNYEGSMTTQQMTTQKIITSLKMAIKNQISLKREQTIEQSHQFLCNTIEKCIFDLENLFELYTNTRIEWQRQKCDNQLKAIKSYKENKLNKNGQFVQVEKQRNLLNIRYEAQSSENDQLKRKLLQTFEQVKNIRMTNSKLQNTINQLQDKIKSKQIDIKKFSEENDRLMMKIKENQQISRKHVDYFKRKSEQIQQQNQRLVFLHRDAVYRQKQLIKIAEDGEHEVQNLIEEAHRLKLELQAFHFKMQEIIQKQQKIKSLQNLIRGNGAQEQKSLREVKNKLSSTEQIESRQALKADRKFNLQHFQQKLCNSTTSLVF